MDEDRLGLVLERVKQLIQTHDPSDLLKPGVLDDARWLAESIHDAPNLEVNYALGMLHWLRYVAQLEDQNEDDLAEDDLHAAVGMFVACFIFGLKVPGALLPLVADNSAPTADELLRQALESPEQQQVDFVADLWQRIVEASPQGHMHRAAYLSRLGSSLFLRFTLTGEDTDLDQAVVARQRAVAACPVGHPDRTGRLSDLSIATRARFEHSGHQEDLDAVIALDQEVVAATPDGHPNKALILAGLGIAFRNRFELRHERADLDEAISAGRQALDAIDGNDPARWAYLSSLGESVRLKTHITGKLEDLDAAIAADQETVTAISPDNSDWAGLHSNLCINLRIRFERQAVSADLNRALAAGWTAVDCTPVGHPDRANHLAGLAVALRLQFEQTGDSDALDAAIVMQQEELAVTQVDELQLPIRQGWLSLDYYHRFNRTGSPADLDQAVALGRRATSSVPANNSSRNGLFNNLGLALLARFERTGLIEDLDEAIAVHREAVDSASSDSERATSLANLGMSLRTRFDRTGAIADLDSAIAAGRKAIESTERGELDRAGMLSALCASLAVRFDRIGFQQDLDEAIAFGRAAAKAAREGDEIRPISLSNVGSALRTRSAHIGSPEDLDEAITFGREAVRATPIGNRNRARFLSNLSVALLNRFERNGASEDLDEAIILGQAAIAATPEDSPDRARYLTNLGGVLREKFKLTGSISHADEAFSVLADAADVLVASPAVRITAAMAASSLVLNNDVSRAAELMERAVRLLPEVAPRQLERTDQQYRLSEFAGLAGDAAALALTDSRSPAHDRAERALGLLETGRAVIISQMLDTRSDLTDLREWRPDLAARFTELRELLDRQSTEYSTEMRIPGNVDPSSGQWRREVQSDRHQLASEFTAVQDQIRKLKGFESFALPQTIGDFLSDADLGPIVTFNISAVRSDALLLTNEGVTSLELPDLTPDALIAQINSFYRALQTTVDTDASPPTRYRAQTALSGILEWLWDTAADPVLQALGYHEQPQPGVEWPRIWWAPGGYLGLLPIHAAGYHSSELDERVRRTVMDRVISSYTSTIRALRYARQNSRSVAVSGAGLIVAMPVTPGLPGNGSLPNVIAEISMLADYLPQHILLIESDYSDVTPQGKFADIPTKANVFAYLPDCVIAHFACHGASDPTDPSKSLLLLHDHDEDPLTVASLAPINLNKAQLAYLSACHTALSRNSRLADEAIHLTTAFQLAGFPHVIGTLWEINDRLAVELARNFYSALQTDTFAFDTSHAAHALHHAVRVIRDVYPRMPSLWAAYLHAGA